MTKIQEKGLIIILKKTHSLLITRILKINLMMTEPQIILDDLKLSNQNRIRLQILIYLNLKTSPKLI
jgi:hypothetical protein